MERFEDVVIDRVYYALPCVMGESEYGIYNNTVDAACVALTERYMNLKVDGVLTEPIKCEAGAFGAEAITDFAKAVARKCSNPHVYSRSDVVEMYTGEKKMLYALAEASLLHEPLTIRDSFLKTFIKFEKCNIEKAPRIINPRSTRYTLELARYLKRLEKSAYRAINKIFKSHTEHTVIKGLNIVDSANVIRNKWERFLDPVFVGGDITKLDMHIGVPALQFEHSIYNMIFRSRKLKKLLKWQLVNRGRAYFRDGSVSFKMEGTRSSGDINTSLGNVLIVCAVIYVACKEMGLDCELINNGDDFGLIFERERLAEVLAYLPGCFRKHGFLLTMEKPTSTFEKLEFCQCKPVFDGTTWRMCRIPQTVFKKDTICTVAIPNQKMWASWLAAVGDCGSFLTKGLPVLSEFYAMYKRSGSDYTDAQYQRIFKNTSAFQSRHNCQNFNATITEEARYSFARAFGILPDMQRELENYFRSITIGMEMVDMIGHIRDNILIYPSLIL